MSALSPTKSEEAIVYVVDDDASVRASLEDLLSSMGLTTVTFGSAVEFMAAHRPAIPSCLILDVRMPRMSGLEFQGEMHRLGISLPVIFITGHGDIQMSVKAMKAGAMEFLTKPFREQDLLDAIQQGLERDRETKRLQAIDAELKNKHARLTAGEQQVMARVVSGLLNKQIAAQLGVSEVTVKVRRGVLMKKMGADSLADLVKQSERLRRD